MASMFCAAMHPQLFSWLGCPKMQRFWCVQMVMKYEAGGRVVIPFHARRFALRIWHEKPFWHLAVKADESSAL